MSERIDVLAVLDQALEDCEWLIRNSIKTMEVSPTQLREARAAVAELVDDLRLLAAGESRDEHGRIWTGFDTDDVIAFARRALARIAPNELHDKAAELRGRGE